MGLPLTWVTLNLMQLFWTDMSADNVGINHYLTRSTTRICGDDLVGHWKSRQVAAYEKLVE